MKDILNKIFWNNETKKYYVLAKNEKEYNKIIDTFAKQIFHFGDNKDFNIKPKDLFVIK
jgi:hypothetical protein